MATRNPFIDPIEAPDLATKIVAKDGSDAAGYVTIADVLAVPVGMASLRHFGAVGNGVTNDSAAFQEALASGLRLTGDGKTYAVSGNFELPDNFYIEDATFKQLDPNNAGRRTLTKITGSGPGILRRVKVDRNGATTHGTVEDAAGIWLGNINDLVLEDVEVTGDGPGKGMLFDTCERVQVIRPYIHDMQWSAGSDPATEQISGITAVISTDVAILEPKISNLTGVIAAAPERAYQTDGISMGGCTNVTVTGGMIEMCGEGIDTYSSLLSTNVWLYDVVVKDIDSWGIKLGSVHYSGAIGCRARDCGLSGFAVGSNSTTPAGFAPTSVRLVNCISIDAGSNGIWSGSGPRGFSLLWDGTVGVMPTDVQYINCSAVDTGATMALGFYVENSAGLTLTTINPYSVGHTTAYGLVGGTNVSFMPTMFDTVIPDNIHIGGTSAPLAHMQLTENGDASTTLPLYLRNGHGTAGTEVGISFDPTGNGKNARDAIITGGTTGGNVTYLSFKVASGGVPAEKLLIASTLVVPRVPLRVTDNTAATSIATGCGIFDGGVGITEELWVGGRVVAVANGVNTKQAVSNVHDTTPTAAELTSAFGSPATRGRGWIGTVDDADGDTNGYICWTSDASWYFLKGTKAV